MDTQQFAQVKKLFALVCDLPAADRLAALQGCSADREVIEEVLALAGQETLRTTRFSQPVIGALVNIAHSPLQSGDVLDSWTLIDEIGHGGMGRVYRARRSDGHFDQAAAIKLLAGFGSQRTLEYFARERQILASLAHPNIARLLDGGSTSDGQPYLVMEYVEGLPIDQYCQRNRLTRSAVLTLFMQVCAAVAFAHQRLVVHCDLKPSNILVTPEGRPVLLDFGVSRLLGAANAADEPTSGAPEDSGNALTLTGMAFTPRYASPEQKARGQVGTGSDIYSLGLMLAELLGAKISATSENQSVSTGLGADLGAIIARATVHDPASRYSSASALATDVQRYLDHQPLAAQPHTAAYVAGKLLRRQWPWAIAASVVAVILGIAVWRVLLERDAAVQANATAQRERELAVDARRIAEAAEVDAASERDSAKLAQAAAMEAGAVAEAGRVRATAAESRALRARDEATSAVASSKRVNQFLVSIFSGIDPGKGGNKEASAREVVALAEKKLDDLKGVSARDRADLFSALSQVHTSLGANADAERYQTRTAAALAEIGDSVAAERVTVLTNLSRMRARRAEGDALGPANEALAITDAKLGKFSVYAGRALLAQASALSALHRRDEEQLSRARAKEVFENLPLTPQTVMDANIYWGDTGHVEFARGNFSAAETAYRRALDGIARFPSIYKNDKFNVFLMQRSLARTLHSLSRYSEAEALLVDAYAECVKRNGAASHQCLSIDESFAFVLVGQGKLNEAIPIQQRRVSQIAALEGRTSILYATALSDYARTLVRLGGAENLAKAEPMLREAFSTVTQLENRTAVRQSIIGDTLLEYLRQQKSFDEALDVAKQLLIANRMFASEDSDAVLKAVIRVARHEQLLGQYGAASKRLTSIRQHVEKMTPFAAFAYHDVNLQGLRSAGASSDELVAAQRDLLAAAKLAYGVNSAIVKRLQAEINDSAAMSGAK